jgi:hypothetical protein
MGLAYIRNMRFLALRPGRGLLLKNGTGHENVPSFRFNVLYSYFS